MSDSEAKPMRLSKLLSNKGICSRREADRFIENGWVKIDGELAVLGQKVTEDVNIELLGEARKLLDDSLTILVNKPVGYVSNMPEKNYKEARKLLIPDNRDPACLKINQPPHLDPRGLANLAVAGRLDIESQGLLVFTQSGKVAKKLIGENSKIEREYLVRVKGTLKKEELALLNHGLSLDGKKLKPAQVDWLNEDQLRFILHEGKKRQIRRMCDEVGLKVLGLKRVRIGQIMLGHLPESSWRVLQVDELF